MVHRRQREDQDGRGGREVKLVGKFLVGTIHTAQFGEFRKLLPGEMHMRPRFGRVLVLHEITLFVGPRSIG